MIGSDPRLTYCSKLFVRVVARVEGGDIMNKIERHEQICNEIHEMYIKKNADYGHSVSELYKKLGDVSL